jgi:hypothetical protein
MPGASKSIVLCVSTASTSSSDPESTRIAPPPGPVVGLPPVSVTFSSVTVPAAGAALVTLKMRERPFASITELDAPAPLMVRFVSIGIWPAVTM